MHEFARYLISICLLIYVFASPGIFCLLYAFVYCTRLESPPVTFGLEKLACAKLAMRAKVKAASRFKVERNPKLPHRSQLTLG